jgi:F420-non-reducing hydrogenase small subunit
MTLLHIGDAILEILPKVEFVHSPVVMDHKYNGQTGEGTKMELPAADVGMLSECVRTEENKEVVQEMRAKCKVLIANGACASWGGVPSGSNIDESRSSGAIGLG